MILVRVAPEPDHNRLKSLNPFRVGHLGLFGGFGHYFLVRAFELAPAPVVAPLNYGQLIGATLLGMMVFGQVPDYWTWLGAAIIAGSGLIMLWAERRKVGPQGVVPAR